MAIINPTAPKPSLINGELQVDDRLLSDSIAVADREQKNLQDQQQLRKKTLTFNQTSYSGVDIKVLVHKYGTPTVDLTADINLAIGVYSQIQSILSTLATSTVPRLGLAGFDLKSGEITSLGYIAVTEEYKQYIQQINALENSIKSTGFMQFIGQSLSGRLVDAQKNASVFSSELFRTISFLDDLLNGWKSQTSALQARSSEFISTKVLAELQTISISSYREKAPVRAFSNVGVKGYTRGPRTVAGTMIFTVFDRNVLFELLDTSRFDADDNFRAGIKDQLPPLDITILFANEYGALSRQSIYGVEFISEGQTMSIEDIIMEDTCQFVARDVDPMTPVLNEQGESYNNVLLNYNQAVALGRGGLPVVDLRASDLRGSEWDKETQSSNSAVGRFKSRTNPFF